MGMQFSGDGLVWSSTDKLQCLLLAGSVALLRLKSTLKRFQLGAFMAVASLGLAAFKTIRHSTIALEDELLRGLDEASTILYVVMCAINALASLSLPRRPEVFRDGKVVDAQYTCSALQRSGRNSFSLMMMILIAYV